MNFIAKFGRAILAAGGLIGLYYVPADLQGWRDASEPWRRVIAMFDRETIALTVATIALIYIIWIDLRPFALRALSRPLVRASPVQCWWSTYSAEGKQWYHCAYFLPVTNVAKDAKALLNVRANLFSAFDSGYVPFNQADGEKSITLASGETAYVFLGHTLSKEMPQQSIMRPKMPPPSRQMAASAIANMGRGQIILLATNVFFAPAEDRSAETTPGYKIAVQLLFQEGKSVVFRVGIGAVNGALDLKVEDLKGEVVEPQGFLGLAAKKRR